MKKSFTVLGGDARQRYLAQYLKKQGCTVHTFAVAEMEDSPLWREADIWILPTPAFSAGRIRGTELTSGDIPQDKAVFGGKLGEKREGWEDVLSWESLVIANAVPTAEGALQLAMEAMKTTVHGSRFLVIGAGRIGMCLAMKLQALGACVTVSARKERDFARIRALGMYPAVTGRYENLGMYDGVFNTVPAPVFTKEDLAQLQKDCFCMELASAPGGFPQGFPVIDGGALPGRVAPKTAGEAIADAILTKLNP